MVWRGGTLRTGVGRVIHRDSKVYCSNVRSWKERKKKSESNLNEIMHLKKTLKMLKSYTNVSCKCKYS